VLQEEEQTSEGEKERVKSEDEIEGEFEECREREGLEVIVSHCGWEIEEERAEAAG